MRDIRCKRNVEAALLAYLLIILAVTLFPYHFLIGEMASSFADRFLLMEWSGWPDFLLNIFLYLPLGFGLAFCVQAKNFSNMKAFIVVLMIGGVLSFSTELLQVFMPSRNSTFTDLSSNMLGTALGFFCIPSRLRGLKEITERSLSTKKLVILFLCFGAVAFYVSFRLQKLTDLGNWDKAFPLILGNEKTGDRPWAGQIFELQIFDSAVSAEEAKDIAAGKWPHEVMENSILVSYASTGDGGYRDRVGRIPEWVRHGAADGEGAIHPRYWLETSGAASYLVERIMRSSHFTLIIKVATAHGIQTGPARIVSLSVDPFRRNFTLGQSEHDLVFRLRTPMTGENGTRPELIARNVFRTTDAQNLIITYDGSMVSLFVNGVRHPSTLELCPGAALFSYFLSLDLFSMKGYKVLYYSFIFLPLGVILTLIAKRLKPSSLAKTLLLLGGVFVPPVMLETILIEITGKFLSFENLFYGLLFTAIPVMIWKYADYPFLDKGA